MEMLLFILFLGMIIYGFAMSSHGRDVIQTAVGRPTEEAQPTLRIHGRPRNLPPKETVPNRRESFGLRR